MAIVFHADVLDVSHEDWGTVVYLTAGDTLEDERYLMLQRKHRYSDEDVHRGMADVYIETCGQGWSWYGHIESFELAPGGIQVRLDASAAKEMGDDGVIEVTFDFSAERREALRTALREVFADRTQYVERD